MKQFVIFGVIQSPEGPYSAQLSLGKVFASIEEATAAAVARIRSEESPSERALTDLTIYEIGEGGFVNPRVHVHGRYDTAEPSMRPA